MTIDFGTALTRTQIDGPGDDPAQARAQLDSIIARLNEKFVGVKLIQETDLSSNGINGTVAETSGGGFPNVNADVGASDEDIDNLEGRAAAIIWGSDNDGAGSGLEADNADTVDGYHISYDSGSNILNIDS